MTIVWRCLGSWALPVLVLGLAACSNGRGSLEGSDGGQQQAPQKVTIGGTIDGLAGSGLVLQNNGGDNLTVSANGTFNFTTSVDAGSPYNITVLTQPANPSQGCTVANAAGTATSNVTSVAVTCSTGSFSVGGTVSGLAGSGLALRNNGGDDLAIASNGSFTFATELASGSAFEVAVATQPTRPSQTCTVADAAERSAARMCARSRSAARRTSTRSAARSAGCKARAWCCGTTAATTSVCNRTEPSRSPRRFQRLSVQCHRRHGSERAGAGVLDPEWLWNGCRSRHRHHRRHLCAARVHDRRHHQQPERHRDGPRQQRRGSVHADCGRAIHVPDCRFEWYDVPGHGSHPADSPLAVVSGRERRRRRGRRNVTNITITCFTIGFGVGGTVSGLDSPGLELQTNGEKLGIAANGKFVVPASLPDGSPYGDDRQAAGEPGVHGRQRTRHDREADAKASP